MERPLRWMRGATLGAAVLSTWVGVACGSVDNIPDPGASGGADASTDGSSGGSAGNTGGNNGTGGGTCMLDCGSPGGTGGSAATGGSGAGGSAATGGAGAGGSGATGGAASDAGATGGTGGMSSCRADVLWAFDTSGSMLDDWAGVVSGFEEFGRSIVASGLDAHVVVLAGQATVAGLPGLCVAPPLGSGACTPAGADSLAPRLFHHPTAVIGSNDELGVILGTFAAYRSTFRPGVKKFLVHISDDDIGPPPNPTPEQFATQFDALDVANHAPGGVRAWTFSAMFSYTACPTGFAEGVLVRQLVQSTGGVASDICTPDPAAFVTQLMQHIRLRAGCP